MKDESIQTIDWSSIAPLELTSIPANGAFAALDALRAEWVRYLGQLQEQERVRVRQRTLRRLAVETGIIERLYDVDWGVTLTLVSEGFSKDVIERAGGRVDEGTLATLVAQRDSLEMVLAFVRDQRALTDSFIKELHAAMTRTQETYDVTDVLGRPSRRPLSHGAWKTQPNHVVRPVDGTILEYAPPEHVQSEIDRLLTLYAELEQRKDVHPIVKVAWFHHRFVQIHPFEDGNGRVARALAFLGLERHKYAPLVVDRFHRGDYLDALDRANAGDLKPLVQLFTRLESAALASELERPYEPDEPGASGDIARTLAHQIAEVRRRKAGVIQQALRTRAVAIDARVSQWFDRKKRDLRSIFVDQEVLDASVDAFRAGPDDERVHWFRGQIVRSARAAGHYADFSSWSSWASLRVRIKEEGIQLRYVASIHRAGRDAGVMAVTTCADVGPYQKDKSGDADVPAFEDIQTTTDAFLFVHTESMESLDARNTELEMLLDTGLTVALARLGREI